MPKIIEAPTLLLGGSGFLGSYFTKSLPTGSLIHTSARDENPVLDGMVKKFSRFDSKASIEKFLHGVEFKNVINCIALANIEECERNPALAKWLNVELPGVVAGHCRSIGASMIHVSTDAVFDGSIQQRSESELPVPVSTYGRSKLEGENRILQTLPQSLVVRVNFFGHSRRKESLFDYFYSTMKSGQEVLAYDDVFFTPTYAADTVRLILELAGKSCTGIFHVVGNERISKYEFARKISNIFEFDSRYITRMEAPIDKMGILRGHDLSLDNRKLKSLGASPRSIEDGLLSLKLEMERINAS